MVERARLESEYTGNRIGGSNPPLSAKMIYHMAKHLKKRPIADFDHFIVGIENSAPARKPVGQRAVIVFIRV